MLSVTLNVVMMVVVAPFQVVNKTTSVQIQNNLALLQIFLYCRNNLV